LDKELERGRTVPLRFPFQQKSSSFLLIPKFIAITKRPSFLLKVETQW